MAGEKNDFDFLSNMDEYLFGYVGEKRKEMFDMIGNMERGIKQVFEKYNGKKEFAMWNLKEMDVK